MLDITIHIDVVEMEAQWNTWSWWQLVLLMPPPLENPQYLQNLFKEKDVKKASILKRCQNQPQSLTAKPVQGYLWRHSVYCLLCCWCGIGEMWMFIWLNEEVAKCCSLLRPTTWHIYLGHGCAAVSSWTWMLKLSPLNLHDWQVVLMGRQHLHLLLCSKVKMRDG